MKYPRMVGLFVLVLFALWPLPSRAQSIWQQRNPRFAYLFEDSKAKYVGDVVTILVSENTDLQNRDQRTLDKSSDGAFSFDSSAANVDITGNSSRSFDGSSQYRVAQEFTDRITVQVLEVLPNGNLLVGGIRRRVIGEEERQLEVSGTIRPIDISPDNSIRSQFVANFQVRYSGCGPESHFTNQGWLARVITRAWPF